MILLGRGRVAPLLIAGLLSPLAVGTGNAAAPGKVKVGVDRKTQVSFSVNGRSVDVRLRPDVNGKPNPLVANLSGASVVLACRGVSPKHHRVLVADAEAMWPDATESFTLRLSRDASDAMQWCVMEQPDGTDIAVTKKLRTPKPIAPDA